MGAVAATLLAACAASPAWKRAPSSAGEIAVFLQGQADKALPDPGKTFPINSLDDKARDRVTIRFEQEIARHESQNGGFDIPISGAGIVALLKDGKLLSVNSSLENPPAVSFVWKNPGFDTTGFSDSELKS